MLWFRATWETVTEESAEAGDAEERGFLSPEGDFSGGRKPHNMRLRDALACLSPEETDAELESVEADDSDVSRARSVRATWRRNGGLSWLDGWRDESEREPRRIVSESRAVHFPDSISPASRARLVRLLSTL